MERSRRLAAVWFADIVGYTDLSARDQEAAFEAVLDLQRMALEEAEAHGGRVVKHIGDAVLAVFESADGAVRAALRVRDAFGARSAAADRLRVGVHVGEIVQTADGDIYGDGVNIASRIQAEADAGQVVVSEDVRRLLRSLADHRFRSLGAASLKGVPDPVPLHAAGEEGAPDGPGPAPPAPTPEVYSAVTRHWPKIAVGAATAAALVADLGSGLLADGPVQSYVFAWTALTAGLWFLFDKAEDALSPEVKQAVSSMMRADRARAAFASIPRQFTLLFDRLFGERHLSATCFVRSSIASMITVALFSVLVLAVGGGIDTVASGPLGVRPFLFVGGMGVVVLGPMLFYQAARSLLAAVLRTRTWGRFADRAAGRLVPPVITWEGMPEEARLQLEDYRRRDLGTARAAVDAAAEGAVRAWMLGAFALPFLWMLRVAASGDPLDGLPPALLPLLATVFVWVGVVLLSGLFNLIPDYVSLLETRFLMGRISSVRGLVAGVGLDVVLTATLSAGSIWLFLAYANASGVPPVGVDLGSPLSVLTALTTGSGGVMGIEAVYFYSAFFTSVWLWLYGLALLVSRVLLRMNGGVGFLLRVTDVERHPLRSLGFVSVVLVSVLFVVGLPFVLV